MANDKSLLELWQQFLDEWPVSRIESMSLDEYSRAGTQNSFTYWLEFKLDKLGSMKGGVSQKYGIYSRDDKTSRENERGRVYDEEYGWYSKYGASREEAFSRVKSLVLNTVRASERGDLVSIEETDLAPTFKWKIAFHYQNRVAPCVVAVFKSQMLEDFLKLPRGLTMDELQRRTMALKKPNEDLIDFSRRVWSSSRNEFRFWKISHGNTLSKADRDFYLQNKLIAIHKDTGKNQAETFATQTDEFGNKLLIDDHFYLCFGNREGPILLGRVTSECSVSEINPDYLVRSYELIASPFRSNSYDGIQKKWTPNYNSTLGRVEESEAYLFEDLILKPYFSRDLQSLGINLIGNLLEKNSSEDVLTNFYWITANISIWNPNDFAVGEEQSYTLYNENGRKRRIFGYFCEAKPGDKAVLYVSSPIRRIVGEAEITKGIDDPDSKNARLHFRITRLFEDGPTREEMLSNPILVQSEPLTGNGQGSIFKLTRHEFDTIVDDLSDDRVTVGKELMSQNLDIEDILEGVYLDRKQFDEIINSINSKKNLILQGPPGSGKSFLAKRIAMALTDDRTLSRVTWVQFHQSFTYEDFIRGYKPTDRGGFSLQDGIFVRACQKAATTPGIQVVIIDEMNRGNVSKILGEMLYLLEADKRSVESAIPLAYRHQTDLNEKFWVPENLLIIGLANTADRSLVPIDQALRRRFAFFDCRPRFLHSKFISHLTDAGFEENRINDLVSALESLNAEINKKRDLGPGFEIGHSYFCLPSRQVANLNEWLKNVIDFEISHLLKEHFVDDLVRAEFWVKKLGRI